MKKVIVILFILLFLGCDHNKYHDEPIVIISEPLVTSDRNYKFRYMITYKDTNIGFNKIYMTGYLYSNDTLKVGTTLYLKAEK